MGWPLAVLLLLALGSPDPQSVTTHPTEPDVTNNVSNFYSVEEPAEVFAQLYQFDPEGVVANDIAITNTGEWVGWKTADGGLTGTLATVVDDPVADHIVTALPGAYRVTLTMTFSASPATVVRCACFINNAPSTFIRFARSVGSANEVGAAAAGGVVVLLPDSRIDVRCTTLNTNNRVINIWFATLSVTKIRQPS